MHDTLLQLNLTLCLCFHVAIVAACERLSKRRLKGIKESIKCKVKWADRKLVKNHILIISYSGGLSVTIKPALH